MFKSSLETTIRENNDGTGRKTHNKQKTVCGHLKKVRVFELGDKSMKIFVGKYTIGRQCLMTDTGRESFLKGKEHDCVVATCML